MSTLFPLTLTDAKVTRRGKTLLGPVSIRLPEGGFTLVIGPNGAGKTTFLKTLHGLERLSSGDVAWAVPVRDARHRQAYVFQRPIMLRRSVADNLAYPLKLAGVSAAERQNAVQTWAARIGLSDLLQHAAPRLSGGEQQKLALARALINQPDALFLDEPCANLDGPATRDIETLLRQAHDTGTRIVMTTHNIGQVRRLASDVIFLHHGLIHEAGPAQQLLEDPQSPELAAFLQGDIV